MARSTSDRCASDAAALGMIAGMFGMATASAADINDAKAIPNLQQDGRGEYAEFLNKRKHRAFAIGAGGAWAWVDGQASAADAGDGALKTCRKKAKNNCIVYAVDDEVVFDPAKWAGVWAPYKSAAEADGAKRGVVRGQRFPDLAFQTADGRPVKMSDFRGKVVFVQFWGSWCPPCRDEMPEINKLFTKVRGNSDLAFVLLQAFETIGKSTSWMKGYGFDLPLYDSGIDSRARTEAVLVDGTVIPRADVVNLFPTSWVLDKHGLVLFHKRGAFYKWPDLAPLLEHAAAN